MVGNSKIGIVTVTYNSAVVLPDFFDSLEAQSNSGFTLYIVDNASKDATISSCRDRHDLPIKLIANEKNLGVAEGNNQGIRAALADNCDYILLLNNDTVFPADFLDSLLAGLEEHRCDMVTCKMYFHDSPERIWCAGGRFQPLLAYESKHVGEREIDRGQFDRARRISYTPTCCLLVLNEVFSTVGLMDERFFVYSDDVDFLYRCLRQNISLWFIPEAKLWHKVSSLTGDVSDFSSYYLTRNRIFFIRKHLPLWQGFAWMVYSQMRSTFAFLVRHISFSRWKIRMKAAREGFGMVRRHTGSSNERATQPRQQNAGRITTSE